MNHNERPEITSQPVPATKRQSWLARLATRNSFVLALFAMLCAIIVCEKAFPQIDEITENYFDEAITEAGVTFATARAINAGISLIKESTVMATVFGAGVDIAAGQLLDPLDDVVERLSDILFTTIISLSIQKIIYEIIGEFAVYLLAILIAGTLVTSYFSHNGRVRAFDTFLKKAALLIVLARVALPCTALVSEGIEKYFFTPRIEVCQAQLKIFESETALDFSDDDGWMDKSSKLVDFVKEQFVAYKNNVAKIVETSLEISGLYVALFAVQVIILPLGAFLILIKATNMLFSTRHPYVFRNPLSRNRALHARNNKSVH